MEAFVEDEDPMDYFSPQNQQDQPQSELRQISKPSFSLMGNGDVDEDPVEETGARNPDQAESSKENTVSNNITNLNNNNATANNPNNNNTSSKDSKDAGSWSNQATSILLDVFREKRVAINGRNFRGEEWEELAAGVNERCFQLHQSSSNAGNASTNVGGGGNSSPSSSINGALQNQMKLEQWKNAKQCSYKMSNLKRKYKSEKEMLQLSSHNGSSSACSSSWQWFSKMEAIFGCDPKYAGLSSDLLIHHHHQLGSSKADVLIDEDQDLVATNNMNMNMNNTTLKNSEQPSSTNFPASKSASTTNLDDRDTTTESSPRSMLELHHSNKNQVNQSPHHHLFGCQNQSTLNHQNHEQAKKKQCLIADKDSSLIPASFSDSIKLMLAQQKETLNLLRELLGAGSRGLIVQQQQNSHQNQQPQRQEQQHQRHETEGGEFGTRRDFVDIKLKIESADRELIYLKQLVESKEKELKDATLAYEDKSRLKNDLVRKLMEAVYETEMSKLRRLASLDRNVESFMQHGRI